ncbi:MAG TPA: class I SAM-dependent methyltransferase [Verrucomicrobiae bacterium]
MSKVPNETAQTDGFEFAALNEAKNYRRALLNEFSKFLRGSVLEVGAGIGQITQELLRNPAITKVVSIEPDAAFCGRLRAAFPGHAIVQGTIEDLKGDDDWNAIFSANVLEHIDEDERELKIYREKLGRQQGALCLFVPARPEIYAPIDRDFGHFRRYTKPELRAKLEQAGFQIVKLRYYNFVGYFAWWLNFRLLKKRSLDVGAVRFFDRMIFPSVHGFESRVCPPFIGQSLLAVARAKPI